VARGWGSGGDLNGIAKRNLNETRRNSYVKETAGPARGVGGGGGIIWLLAGGRTGVRNGRAKRRKLIGGQGCGGKGGDVSVETDWGGKKAYGMELQATQ